jgi:hypothetical protein
MPGDADLNDFMQPSPKTPLQHLRDELAVAHATSPQKNALAQMAVSEIESGLARLSSMGFHFHLEPGTGQAPKEWPRMFYHAKRCPEGRVFICQEDVDELNEGDGMWAPTPQEAASRAGLAKQLERGGVHVGRSLAPTDLVPALEPPPTRAEKIARARGQAAPNGELK